MFDPFEDFDTAGYLRNIDGEKDPLIVKEQEHAFFLAGLDKALAFLRRRRPITYEDFLKVHKILFGDFYPWAGQDRSVTAPGLAIFKNEGAVRFEHPQLCRRAVEWGLQMGNDPAQMRAAPGKIMGVFAWAHPFLDGNGRTMLLVHAELCARSGFSIDWIRTGKDDYLNALTQEIATPGRGVLDQYLRPFIVKVTKPSAWAERLRTMPGLRGTREDAMVNAEDPQAQQLYRAYVEKRGYTVQEASFKAD